MSNPTPKRAATTRAPRTAAKTAKTAVTQQRNLSTVSAYAEGRPKPQDFIVQNIGQGWVCISDIGLDLPAGRWMDMTYWDHTKVLGSMDLQRALIDGLLQEITREEAEALMREEYADARAAELAAATRDQRRRRKIQVDGRDEALEADLINLSKPDSGSARGSVISSYGMDNDPVSYAAAFRIAKDDAEAAGRTLTAKSFRSWVQSRPGLVKKLLETGGNGVVSGDMNRGRATTATTTESGSAVPTKFAMTNYNRDEQIAGSYEANLQSYKSRDDLYTDMIEDDLDIDELGNAESIDLSLDYDAEFDIDGDDDNAGGIKRVGR